MNSSSSSNHIWICIWRAKKPEPSKSCGKVNEEIYLTLYEFENKLNETYELDKSYKAEPIVICKFYIFEYVQYVTVFIHYFLFTPDEQHIRFGCGS